jgi:hypothetical protein
MALSVDTRMFRTGHFDNPQASFTHAQANLGLYLEPVRIDLYVVQAISPESIIAIAEIAETHMKQLVHKSTEAEVAQPP